MCDGCKHSKKKIEDFTDIPFDQELEMLQESAVYCWNCEEAYIPSLSENKCPCCGMKETCKKTDGLYGKYKVVKADTGEEVEQFCFVLKPEKDPVAFYCLRMYSELTHDEALKKDLKRVLEEIEYIYYSGK